MLIRELEQGEYESALQLSWEVFQMYEAPDYSEEGTRAFFTSIHNPDYFNMLKIYGAFYQEELVGVLATRNEGNHIALFFVKGEYHRNGIGRQLFERGCQDNITGQMTVNSAPYAIDIYHHLGFVDIDVEQLTDGIRYTPMKWCREADAVDRSELVLNLDKLHTTELGIERIRRNLCLDVDDVVEWCRERIQLPESRIVRKGKNWYVNIAGCEITVNAYSYTIITAHQVKKRKD